MKNSFIEVATNENNPKWKKVIKREKNLYSRGNDIRSEFERDYNRIIHTTAYRRMKHKTQVFFSPSNDHICTRGEHIVHVESISHTIANFLGLNTELTKAIATAHDIGHSPFGHAGEKILSDISLKDCSKSFWHERNGLEIVDKIELLEDNKKNKQNLNLTYGVRDGIISHCGEIDENNLKPRDEYINLDEYTRPNQFAPYTWEGCVVKISDKISYLARDIEDAITLGIIDEHLNELYELLNFGKKDIINKTVLINELVYDLCENSSIKNGLCFSDKIFNMINEIKKFNYKNIYASEKNSQAKKYFDLVINTIYDVLKESYTNKEKIIKMYPNVAKDFYKWLEDYWNLKRKANMKNDIIFNMSNEKDFYMAIIYYISGMTDNFAINTYNKIIGN